MTMNVRAGMGKIRIQVISDIHAELTPDAELPAEVVATGADLVILAGDTAHAPDAVMVAAKMFPGVPLVMVGGNHEHYHTGLPINDGFDAMRRAAAGHGLTQKRPVHVLEDEEVVVEVQGVPVRFIGATLWTDFALFDNPVRDRMFVERGLNDFRAIRGRGVNLLSLFMGGDGTKALQTDEWLDRHDASKAFIQARLAVPHPGPTIVVTHHLPSMRSVIPQYRKDRVSAGFASRLDDVVGMCATLWVHGHTHSSRRWRHSCGTLVVCNPAGYVRRNKAGQLWRENVDFDPRLVIDIRRGGPEASWRAGKERPKL